MNFLSGLLAWGTAPASAHAPAAVTPEVPTYGLLIAYSYDPLNRLTSAAYSDGRSFDYTYDQVGNRLTSAENQATLEPTPTPTPTATANPHPHFIFWQYPHSHTDRRLPPRGDLRPWRRRADRRRGEFTGSLAPRHV